MASATKRTSLVRKRKHARAGAKRKTKLRNKGTTQRAADLFKDKK